MYEIRTPKLGSSNRIVWDNPWETYYEYVCIRKLYPVAQDIGYVVKEKSFRIFIKKAEQVNYDGE